MKKIVKELENRKIDYDKLIAYGFVLENNTYTYEKKILNDEFQVIIEIMNNNMLLKVIEIALNDEYLMAYVEEASGEYVGKIKDEYNSLIEDIITKCTYISVFQSVQATEIIQYVKDKYNDDLEYLWAKFPKNAILRNKINKKWYGALLVVSEDKLGLDSNNLIEIIDLRYQSKEIKDIIDNYKVFPGYHMNKNNWITIKLDGSISTKVLITLLDNSYNISLEK